MASRTNVPDEPKYALALFCWVTIHQIQNVGFNKKLKRQIGNVITVLNGQKCQLDDALGW